MRVLVTGASGFIGSALVARLVDGGHHVVAVSRTPERTAEELAIADAVDWDGLTHAFDTGIDAVVHLAGESVQGLWVAGKAGRVSGSRLTCTRQLVDAISQAASPPSVVLSASGIGLYGEGGENELDELAAAGDDFFANLCVDWENMAAELESATCRVGMLRFGIVLGSGGGALKTMLLPTKMGFAGPLGSGKQWWSWVSLADATAAIVFALDNPNMVGPINIVAPQPVRQAEFQQTLSRAVNRPSFMPAPAFALRAVLGTFAEEVLSSKRVLPKRLTEAGFEWQLSELEDAIRAAI